MSLLGWSGAEMAGKKFIKGSEEWMLIVDFWALCQSIWIPEDTEEYIRDTADRVDAFYKKYGTDFVRDLIDVLLREIDRRSGAGNGK